MALVSINHIKKVMEDNECPFWHLTDNGGDKNVIDSNQSEENIESSFELLEQVLAEIEDSIVCITLSNKTRKQKALGGRGHQQYTFKVKLKEKEVAMSMGGNQGMLAMVFQLMDKNNELTRQMLLDKQAREFEERISGLENKPSAFEMALPYLERMIGGQMGIAATGDEDEEVDEEKVNAQETIRAALKQLLAVDPKLPEHLTLLAKFAKKYPKDYKAMIPMLKAKVG